MAGQTNPVLMCQSASPPPLWPLQGKGTTAAVYVGSFVLSNFVYPGVCIVNGYTGENISTRKVNVGRVLFSYNRIPF